MSEFETDLDPGPVPEEDSDDMFEAIAPASSSSPSSKGDSDKGNKIAPASSKDEGNGAGTDGGGEATGGGGNGGGTRRHTGTRSRVGARMIASIEGDLVDVPEVATPLIRILDQFVEDTLPNMQAGIVEFARLATQHLEEWGLDVPANEAARMQRLGEVPADPLKIHESLDDLAVAARYLARVRPEEYVDAGSWRLYRNVRKALRSDNIGFLAEVCRDLSEAVEHDPNHLQGDYLPRIEQRYAELVVRELERLRFILEISPDSAEAYPIAEALAAIDRGVGFLEDLHGKHPHPKLGAFLDEVEKRRKQFVPRLIEHCEAGIKQPEFERIVYLLGALDLLDPQRPSGVALQEARSKLLELLAGLEQHLRDLAAEALSKPEPGPAWRVLSLFRSLPEAKRATGTEFGTLEAELQAHYEKYVAALERDIAAALAGSELEPVDDALARLEGLLEVVPEHALKPKHGELLRHKQKLLEATSRESAIQAAYAALKEKVDGLRANGEASVAQAKEVLAALDGDTLVPAELKQPLRDAAQSRHDQLHALYAALEQETSARVDKKRQAAEVLLTESDRVTLQPLLQKVSEHHEELKAIEQQLGKVNGLKKTLQQAGETEGPKQEAQRIGASLKEVHTSQRYGHPGSVKPRQALGKAVRMANRVCADLDVLAASPARALEALGPFNPESVEAADAPRFAAAQSELAAVKKDAAPTLEHATLLAEQLKQASTSCGQCQELALAWHESRQRMEEDIAAARVRGGHETEISAVAATAASSREPFERLDAYVGAQGRILAWYDAQVAELDEVARRVNEALEARARRRKRVRNAALLVVLLALLVAGGIYGWGLYQDHLRESRAKDLLAQAQAALDETDLEPIDTALEESRAFLAEGENEDEYGALFTDVLDELEERRRMFAGLDDEMARLREKAAEARQRNSGYLGVRDEIVEFRDERALPRHMDELEELRLGMLLGWVKLGAQPGLVAERIREVEAALEETRRRIAVVAEPKLEPQVEEVLEELRERLRELRIAALREIRDRGLAAESVRVVEATQAELAETLAAEEDERVVAAGEEMLVELEAHWLSLRIAALEALAEPGFEAQEAAQVARVISRLEDAVAGEEHPRVVAAGESLVEDLQAHWLSLRIAELEALAQPGLESDDPRVVLRIIRRVERAVATAEHPQLIAHGEDLVERLEAHWLSLRVAQLEAVAAPGLATRDVEEAEAVEAQLLQALDAEEHAEVVEALQPTRERLRTHILRLKLGELAEIAEAALASEDTQVIEDAQQALHEGRETLDEPELRTQVDHYLERLDERLAWLQALAALRERITALLANAELAPDEVVAEHAEILAELREIVAPSGEPRPAESLAVPLADVALREQLLLTAQEALETDMRSALQDAITQIEQALSEERGEMHREALEPYLALMRQRLDEIRAAQEELDRELAELIAQAQQLLAEAETLAPLEDWLERAEAFHVEAPSEHAEQLEPWIARIEQRHQLIAEKLARFEELVAQAEAALASEEVAPLEVAHDDIEAYLHQGEPLSSQVEPLEQWRARLAEALFERIEARGLASEDAQEIRAVGRRLNELVAELPYGGDLLAARIEPAQQRLNARAEYFERRTHVRDEQARRLDATDGLDELAAALEALDTRIGVLDETDTAFDAFGEEPTPHTDIHESQESLRTREGLMLSAVAGLELTRADEVAERAAQIREALQQPGNDIHAAALAPYLALLDRLAELLEAAAEGLGWTDAQAVRGLIAELEEALEPAQAQPLRAPMEVPIDRLRQYAEVLENPDQFAELTLDGPESADTRQATVTGTVSGAPLEIVYIYINGHEQRTSVEAGAFEAVVILRTGDNRVVASPVNSPNHPNAREIGIWGDFASSTVSVMLTWDTATDLDLRVVEPDGTEISWRRRIARGLHGRLDTDERAWGPENYSFTVGPGEQMPAGEYRVYVDYFDGDEPVNWELNIVWYEDTPDEINIQLTGHMDPTEDERNLRAYTFRVNNEGRLVVEEEEGDDNDGGDE